METPSAPKTPPKTTEQLSNANKKDGEVSNDSTAPVGSALHPGENTIATTSSAPTVEDLTAPASPTSERKDGLLHRIWNWSPVLVLENSGSVARDHLASERTWLAYIRTSLAISSSGVALVQLFTIAANRNTTNPVATHIQKFARPLGAATVLIGLGVCLLGLYRYFTIQYSLTTGKFPTARLEVHAISLLLGCLTGIVFGVLVAYPR